jgi:hypothetical protein
VVQIPADTPSGPGQLTVNENGTGQQTSKFNVISVELKADKLNLRKGESTGLHIQVTGLEGCTAADGAKLRIENMTPQVARLSFSREFQSSGAGKTVMTRPVTSNGTGRIIFTETLVGVSPGAFTINAVIFAPPRRD